MQCFDVKHLEKGLNRGGGGAGGGGGGVNKFTGTVSQSAPKAALSTPMQTKFSWNTKRAAAKRYWWTQINIVYNKKIIPENNKPARQLKYVAI